MNIKARIIFSFCAVLFVALGIFRELKKQEELYSEYTTVGKETKINGVISNLKIEKGTAFISLDSIKIVLGSSENYNYKYRSLSDHLHIGAKIEKEAGNDTVKVTYENRTFIFLHNIVVEKD